jgi:hypothetical protein
MMNFNDVVFFIIIGVFIGIFIIIGSVCVIIYKKEIKRLEKFRRLNPLINCLHERIDLIENFTGKRPQELIVTCKEYELLAAESVAIAGKYKCRELLDRRENGMYFEGVWIRTEYVPDKNIPEFIKKDGD